MTDAYADWDGAYVLGALGADDRRRYEEHLADCPDCARAVHELTGIPGILGELGVAEAVALRDAQEDMALRAGAHRPERAAAAGRRVLRRRRRMRFTVAGALVVLLTAGIATGWTVATATAPAPALAAARIMHPVDGSRLTAELAVTPVGWGTRFDWSCDYRGPSPAGGHSPPSATYSLVVHTRSGESITVATWTSDAGEANDLVAATAVPADAIARVDITMTASGQRLASASL